MRILYTHVQYNLKSWPDLYVYDIILYLTEMAFTSTFKKAFLL